MEEQRDPRTHPIIGSATEVQCVPGAGFLKPACQKALAAEFRLGEIPFVKEVPLIVKFKVKTLECRQKADFICYDEVLVELKALATLASIRVISG